MRTSIQNRCVIFFVQDECLVRIVTGEGARTYTHRCAKQAFETVALTMRDTPREGAGVSLAGLARQESLPFTQVNVALEFLKERGLVDVRHRRCYPATPDVYLDAMIEFCALAEGDKFV